MMKIRISYETPQELEKVVTLLQPLKLSVRHPKAQKGAYKKVYITTDVDIKDT